MKKLGYASTVSTLAVSAFVLAGALWQSSAQAATELRMANWLPPVHHLYKSLEAWNEEVAKASGGSLIVKLDKAPLALRPLAPDRRQAASLEIARKFHAHPCI